MKNTYLFRQSLALSSLALGLACSASGQQAGSAVGWQARLFAGADFNQLDRISASYAAPNSAESVDIDRGILFGGAVGYGWANDFTAEFEYTYRTADLSALPTNLFPSASEADIASVLVFANVIYRPQIQSMPRLHPRIGAGVGWLQEVSLDAVTGGVEESFDGDGAAFQLMAGLDYSLTESWLLGVQLNYYTAGSVDLQSETVSSRKLELDYEGFSLIASVGYRF